MALLHIELNTFTMIGLGLIAWLFGILILIQQRKYMRKHFKNKW